MQSMINANRVPVSVIILTYNEEKNIEYCLKNVYDWSDEIYIVDSFSTDETLKIAKKYTDKIYQQKFENYSLQRNWALDNLPIETEWIMFLDADEYLMKELKNEIEMVLPNSQCDGYYIKFRFIFLGRWIKYGGYYPSWILRIFRKGKGQFSREVNERVYINGKTGFLNNDFIHHDRKGLKDWLKKHIKYAEMEAELLSEQKGEAGEISFLRDYLKGTPDRKKKWLRDKVFNNSPLFVRAILFYIYRYFFRLGFLDGKEGFIFHFLHGLWFWFIVDTLYLEKKLKSK